MLLLAYDMTAGNILIIAHKIKISYFSVSIIRIFIFTVLVESLLPSSPFFLLVEDTFSNMVGFKDHIEIYDSEESGDSISSKVHPIVIDDFAANLLGLKDKGNIS